MTSLCRCSPLVVAVVVGAVAVTAAALSSGALRLSYHPADIGRDPLFARFARRSMRRLSTGTLAQSPYHCYSADAVVLMGTASLAAVREAVAASGLKQHPVTIAEHPDRTLAQVWLMDYVTTTLPRYSEVVVSFIVSSHPDKTVSCPSTHCTFKYIYMDPETRLFTWRLWLAANDTADVAEGIAWGREIAGMDKAMVDTIAINRARDASTGGVVKTVNAEDETGALLVHLEMLERLDVVSQVPHLLDLTAAIGVANVVTMLTSASLSAVVVTTPGIASHFHHGNDGTDAHSPELLSTALVDPLRLVPAIQSVPAGDDEASGAAAPPAFRSTPALQGGSYRQGALLDKLGFVPEIATVDPDMAFLMVGPFNGGSQRAA